MSDDHGSGNGGGGVMEVIVVALIVSVIAPLLTATLMSRTRRADKRMDWARQDEVARRARADAQAIVDSNRHIADTVEMKAHETNQKLDVVHTLVNSQLTRAMESERDAIERDLASLDEIIDMKRANGQEPTSVSLELIRSRRAKLDELNALLEQRARDQEVVDMQLSQDKAVADHLKDTLSSAGVALTSPTDPSD